MATVADYEPTRIAATEFQPTEEGWYVAEWGEFNFGPCLLYFTRQDGWQTEPGIESFFGSHVDDVWWGNSKEVIKNFLRTLCH